MIIEWEGGGIEIEREGEREVCVDSSWRARGKGTEIERK